MSELNVTTLDFAQIKQNLRDFLRNQEEFSDYNFEGSALSVLIDLLAYNTHYNAVLAHLMSNEMFLDSAVKRSSVLSIAKTLGYVPQSMTGARATATIVVAGGSASSLTLDTNTAFTGFIDNKVYTFTPVESHTVSLSGGVYTFENVALIEGKRLTNSFSVGTDSRSGPFIIPVSTVDLETLVVYVRDSANATTFTTFNKVDSISGVDNTSPVFWVEERPDGQYQILFGDDIFGRSLQIGNVVVASYVATNGPSANGITQLTGSSVDGQTVVSVVLDGQTSGGGDKESIDSIRKTAPLFNAAKNRAVTTQDYQALISKNFDKAKAVTVWGGEQNVPPIYGKVFITIDPKTDYVITEADKDYIIEKILRPAAVMSIQHEFVDPDYLYVGLSVNVNFDPRLTNYSSSQIAANVQTAIQSYFNDELSTLEKPFFSSKLNTVIQSASSAIVANLFKITLQLRVVPTVGVNLSKTLNFLASLEPETLRSTIFTTNVNGVVSTCYIQDFSDADARRASTTGTLKLVNVDNEQIVGNVGTVDYNTGMMTIINLNVNSMLVDSGDIRFTAEPTDLSKNITSTIVRTTEISKYAVTPLASRNIIIKLDDSESNSDIKLNPGLTVTATPFID